MATILDKKPKTKQEIIDAIIKIGDDKNERLFKDDHIEWLEIKLKEVARLGRKLKKIEK